MYKRFLITAVIIITFFTILPAKEINLTFDFSQPDIFQDQIHSELNHKIRKPGNPIIPYYTSKILIPFGHEIKKINVENSNWQTIEKNKTIKWAQKPYPTSQKNIKITPKNKKVYSANKPYPGKTHELSGCYYISGHKIAILKIFPYRYLPKIGNVEFSQNWKINITTNYSESVANYQSKFLIDNSKIDEEISGFVNN